MDQAQEENHPSSVEDAAGEIDRLVDSVQRACERQVQRDGALRGHLVVLLFGVLIGGLLGTRDWPLPARLIALSFCAGLLLPLLAGPPASRRRECTLPRQDRDAALQLARCTDLRVVGPLIELGMGGPVVKEVTPAARAALIDLLPRLRPSDVALLDEKRRLIFNAFLAGHARLQERDRKAADLLLRPADTPDTPAESLLRPVQGSASADRQVLLRPAESGDES